MPVGRTLRRAVVTFAAATTIVSVAPATAAFADEPEPVPAVDATGPSLGSATADPATVDVSTGVAVVAVTAELSDPNGVASAAAQVAGGPVADLALAGGTATEGTWSGVVTIPAYTPFGPASLGVTAVDSTGAVASSSASVLTVADAVPAAPASLLVVASSDVAGALDVSWLPPVVNGGSDVTAYSVAVSRASGTDPAALVAPSSVVGADARQTTVTGLSYGARYVVRVAAVNAVGTGPELLADAGTDPHEVSVPDAPTAVTAGPSDGALSVTWAAPASSGGVALTAFRVVATPRSVDVPSVFVTAGPDAVGAVVSGLTNGVTYDVAVSALNAVGVGLPSGTAAGTPRTVPGVVLLSSVKAGDGSVEVAWQPPASDGGAPVTSYVVTASPSGVAVTVPGSGTRATVRQVVNGAPVSFTVVAVNEAGPGPSSAPSALVVPHQAASFVVERQPARHVVVGAVSTVTAALRSRAGTGITGQPVELQARVRYSSTWRTLASATTGAGGRATFRVRLPATAALRLHHPLTTVADVTKSVRSVYVATRVSARPSSSRIRVGSSLVVRGSVYPAHRAGQPVRLQRYANRKWVNMATGTMVSPTQYAVSTTPRSVGTLLLRVIKTADGDHETGVSRTWRQTVAPESVTDIARSIRGNRRITLDQAHVSGVRDLAAAWRNVLDLATGHRARRSAYQNAPGGLTSVDRRLLLALRDMGKRGSVTVSEIAGGSHSPGSAHYRGKAIDVSVVNGSPVRRGSGYGLVIAACRKYGARRIFHPTYDPYGGHGGHVHCDWS